ncbi:MAG: polyprenyl synthetase family protein [Pseudomonadota bacterium]
MNTLIPAQLTSDVELVEEIGRYIVESGGKRLRPILVLLGAGACGNTEDRRIALAAVIEFLHTATLLHDDVVDRSGLRRGKQTANAVWGNAPSVLVGDFLYSRAFQLMVTLNDLEILRVLSDATNTIAEGEVLQLARLGDLKLNESQYMEVIRCKTALLFEAATHTAGLLAGAPAEQVEALRCYGEQFGLAYQLMDDYLDYAGDTALLGKNVGDDLAEGKVTLPLIFGMANAPRRQSIVIENAIAERNVQQLDEVVAIVRECGALAYTQQQAARCCHNALAALAPLPQSPYRDGLEQLAEYSLARIS